jgi:hypothetical protein
MWPKSWMKEKSVAVICDSLHKQYWKRNHDLNKETRLPGKAGLQSEYFSKQLTCLLDAVVCVRFR